MPPPPYISVKPPDEGGFFCLLSILAIQDGFSSHGMNVFFDELTCKRPTPTFPHDIPSFHIDLVSIENCPTSCNRPPAIEMKQESDFPLWRR